MSKKTLVWVWIIRVTHWLMAIGFLMAFVSSEFENNMNIHFAFGMFLGVLVLFRIIFGFIGPRYANFKDFPIGPDNITNFLSSLASRSKEKKYLGHNPLASLVMLGIMLSLVFTAISGMAYRANHDVEVLENIHEGLVTISIVLIVFHLLGVFVDLVLKPKEGTFASIFTGYKNQEGDHSQMTAVHKLFAFFWILLPLIAFYIGFSSQDQEHSHDHSSHEEHQEHRHDK